MTVQISNIFTAKAENIWEFLSEQGQGCYIPAYQRPYAWDSDNVDRLVDDVINGITNLQHRAAAISFMGTIIAIHDVNHITVKPVYKADPDEMSTNSLNMRLHRNFPVGMKQTLGNLDRRYVLWVDVGSLGDGTFDAEQKVADLQSVRQALPNLVNDGLRRHYVQVQGAHEL